MRNKKLYSKMK